MVRLISFATPFGNHLILNNCKSVFMKKIDSINRQLLLILTIIFQSFTVACNDQKQSHSMTKEEGMELISHQKPPSSFSDTVIIGNTAAVFYNPDSLQLEKIKAVTDSMIYESGLHDCFYQMRNARNVLTSNYPQIKIHEVNKARYLLFKKNSGESDLIDLNSKGDACGIILFDGYKTPVQVDMTNINSELGFYFSK